MKYALHNNNRIDPSPKAKATCPCCGSHVVAKCGTKKVWHWAHKSKQMCDHWWENETQWHRDWKNCFPEEWQEVVHFAEDGEKHIADVKTPSGFVVEFQHSAISQEERISRENFYNDMCWVIDGTRLKSDLIKFNRAPTLRNLKYPTLMYERVPINFFPSLQKWYLTDKTVFFDFGDKLFCILPTSHRASGMLMFSLSQDKFAEIVSSYGDRSIDFEQILRSEEDFNFLKIS